MKTTDYSIFRTILGNRQVISTHTEHLAEAIERKNLLRYFPVLVNEKMEVIDGQHRLMAAAKLGCEIYYEIVDGLRLDDVMSINTNSKSWSIGDFIDTYIQLGKTDYEVLKSFMRRHQMSSGIASCLLTGGRALAGGSAIAAIRAGVFVVRTVDFANAVAETVSSLERYTDFPTRSDRHFIQAITLLYTNPDFELEHLLAKLRLTSDKISKRPSYQYYLLQIEELYNFKTRQRVELYSSSQVAAEAAVREAAPADKSLEAINAIAETVRSEAHSIKADPYGDEKSKEIFASEISKLAYQAALAELGEMDL